MRCPLLSIDVRIGHWGSLESPVYETSGRSTRVRMLYLSPDSDEYYMVAARNFLAKEKEDTSPGNSSERDISLQRDK